MRESVYHLITALNAIFDAVIVTDRDFRVFRVNPAAEALTGWPEREAVNRPIREVLVLACEARADGVDELIAGALAAGTPVRLAESDLLIARNGTQRPVAGSIAPITRPDGLVLGTVIVFRDQSDEQQRKRELVGREQLLSAILDNLPLSISLKDVAGRYVFVNEVLCRLLKQPREAMLGRTLADLLPGEFAARRAEFEQRALQERRPLTSEGPAVAPAGGYWLTGVTPIVHDPDAPPLLLGYGLDITERYESEMALSESNRIIELIFAQSLEGIFMMRLEQPVEWHDGADKEASLDALLRDMRMTMVNEALLAQYGGTREQMLRMTLAVGFRHDPAGIREVVRRICDAGRLRIEVEERRFDGGVLWMEGDFIMLRDDQGRISGMFGAQRDIGERRRAEQLLLASAERFRATFEQAAVGIGHLDQAFTWLRVNERLCQIAGYASDDLRGHVLSELVHPTERDALRAELDRLTTRQVQFHACEHRLAHPARAQLWIQVTLSLVRRVRGEQLFAVAVVQDITERRQSEALLRASEERFRDVADAAGEYVWEVDADWRYTYVSSRVEAVLGYPQEELLGRRPADFMPEGEPERVAEWLRESVAPSLPFRFLEHRTVTKCGDVIWQQVSGVPVLDALGTTIGYRGTCLDITDRKISAKRIEHLATRDALTGLPNRLLLMDRLEQGIAAAGRKQDIVVLMFIDLDRFKTINDSLGHHVGDLLIKAVAERLSNCVRRGDTLARLGGDEFVVALYGLKDMSDVIAVAQKMLSQVSLPYEIEGHMLSSGCSIGVSVYPADGADVATLMRNADTAMYHAKEKGRNNYQFFSPEMNIRAVERLHLENELRLAVRNGQFTLAYQPQVAILSGEVVGVEALLRWVHPRTGQPVPPARFVSVAEDTGLIVPLGEWVLRTACTQVKAWQDAGLPSLRLAVNLSVGQLRADGSLPQTIADVLEGTGLPAACLDLEMTETMVFTGADDNVKVLDRLGDMGLHISIDDFGTGYSSLSYLKKLPVDAIKIDQSFVHDLVEDESDAAIVAAIVAMARKLKLRVIAEGVESEAQLAELTALQCDEYQGYLFSRPLTTEEFEARFVAPVKPPRTAPLRQATP